MNRRDRRRNNRNRKLIRAEEVVEGENGMEDVMKFLGLCVIWLVVVALSAFTIAIVVFGVGTLFGVW